MSIETRLLKLCDQLQGFAEQGNYANGNKAFGMDEGLYLAGRHLDGLRSQLEALRAEVVRDD